MDNENNERLSRVRNMNALMTFCTEMTASEDTTRPSSFQPMDEERKKFLNKVFAELQDSTGKILSGCLTTLLSDAVVNIDDEICQQEVALDHLAEYAPDLNYSTDIFKIGGFPVIIRCLNSPHSTLRSKAAALIGNICQNDRELQKQMLQMNILPLMVSMTDEDTDDNCRIAALFGVGCIIRNSEEGEQKFFELDGLSCLMRASQSSITKLSIKSICLLCSLIKKEIYTESIIKMGFVEQLSAVVSKSEDDFVKEHASNAILCLAEQCPGARQECLRTELYLMPYLQNRLTTIKGLPKYQEENEYCNKLLEILRIESADDICSR